MSTSNKKESLEDSDEEKDQTQTVIRNIPRFKFLFKFVVLGDSFTGKTTIISRYFRRGFSEIYQSTIGLDFHSHEIVVDDSHIVRMQIWDTAGQERFRSFCSQHYRGADGCVLVFDINNLESFQNLEYWRDEFLLQANFQNASNFPFIVMANKIDLGKRAVTTRQAQQWCSRYKIPYFETSAKEGINIDAGFKTLAKNTIAQEREFSTKMSTLKVQISSKTENDKKCLC